jgi:rod shape-determining protein MreD
VKAVAVVAALAAALALQTTLGRVPAGGVVIADFVLVAVVAVGMTWGATAGMLAGTAGGLVQDALSSGVLGVGGLAKSIAGFLTGVVSAQFIVAQPLPRLVVFAGATVLHAVIFIGLHELLDLRGFGLPVAPVALQAVGNAVAGVVALHVIALVPGIAQRRRAGRSRSYR